MYYHIGSYILKTYCPAFKMHTAFLMILRWFGMLLGCLRSFSKNFLQQTPHKKNPFQTPPPYRTLTGNLKWIYYCTGDHVRATTRVAPYDRTTTYGRSLWSPTTTGRPQGSPLRCYDAGSPTAGALSPGVGSSNGRRPMMASKSERCNTSFSNKAAASASN